MVQFISGQPNAYGRKQRQSTLGTTRAHDCILKNARVPLGVAKNTFASSFRTSLIIHCVRATAGIRLYVLMYHKEFFDIPFSTEH